jgi:hypothetical protein
MRRRARHRGAFGRIAELARNGDMYDQRHQKASHAEHVKRDLPRSGPHEQSRPDTREDRPFMLRLMERFDITFPIPDATDCSLVGLHVPEARPSDVPWNWESPLRREERQWRDLLCGPIALLRDAIGKMECFWPTLRTKRQLCARSPRFERTGRQRSDDG